MIARRSFPSLRAAASVLLLSSIVVYLYCSRYTPSDPEMAERDSVGPLSNLVVSVRQVNKNPLTIALKVMNTGTEPVTILTWESPLDVLALQLGLLSITPSGASSPLDLPRIQLRRKAPPDEDQLVTLEAGQSEEREIALKEPIISSNDLAGDGKGKAKVKCRGRWMSVWPVKRNGVSDEALELMGLSDEALSGDFESEVVELDI